MKSQEERSTFLYNGLVVVLRSETILTASAQMDVLPTSSCLEFDDVGRGLPLVHPSLYLSFCVAESDKRRNGIGPRRNELQRQQGRRGRRRRRERR